MFKRRRKKAPSAPSLKKKLKRIVLDKTKWVRSTRDVAKLREEVLKANGGLCEMTGEVIIRPTLDHDHNERDPQVRGVISQHSNTMEGFIKKYWFKFCYRNTSLTLPQYLRKLADYLEVDWDRGYHHRAVSDYQTKLMYKTIKDLVTYLSEEYNVDLKGTLPDKAGIIDIIVEEYIKRLEEKHHD